MRPRLICRCSSSGRWLASLPFSDEASNTAQYEVKPISTAKRTTTRPKSLTIWRFTSGPPQGEDEVGDDRAAAIADEGQGDAGQRDHPGDAADDDEGLDREDGGEPGREQLREAIGGDQSDLEAPRRDQ